MLSKYLPSVSADTLKQKQAATDYFEYYELLVEPLHEELYSRQSFDFLDDLSDAQQLNTWPEIARDERSRGLMGDPGCRVGDGCIRTHRTATGRMIL